MKYTDYKLIQEKASDLFFNNNSVPDCERDKAWLFDEHTLLAAIRARFGGDHGIELVRLLPCTQQEFYRWCGRKGGMTKSSKKTRAVRLNGGIRKKKEPT